MEKFTLGFDIGGTKCAVVLGRGNIPEKVEDGFIIDKIRFETNQPRGWKLIVDELISSAEKILERNNITSDQVLACGISCGGPLDSKSGVIMSPPNLPDWDNVPIVELTEKALGIKTYLQNDANACALAEWKFGAGRGTENMIFLTFGTGMGAGLILGGRLYSGTNDMAGEVGHMRMAPDGPVGYGKKGSFEGFCSGGGIADLAKLTVLKKLQCGVVPSFCRDESELDSITAKSVAEAACAGDKTAIEIYETCGEYLGKGLAVLIDILNPEAIVIGSIYQRSSALLQQKMEESIRMEALSLSAGVCRIVPAKLGDSIGDYAALGVAFMNITEEV
ncbi:MAG: ROK family protein [Clostridia bacterium]|nr:ROK family protein [Clostridia bacterium]